SAGGPAAYGHGENIGDVESFRMRGRGDQRQDRPQAFLHPLTPALLETRTRRVGARKCVTPRREQLARLSVVSRHSASAQNLHAALNHSASRSFVTFVRTRSYSARTFR